jgi:hypothetical protein
MKIIDFAENHNACESGVTRALDHGIETMQELWNTTNWNHEDRIWVATRKGVLTDRELRLFACWCVRQVWHLLTDERSRNAVEVAEQYANGNATEKELAAASDAAWAAVCDAASAAAWAAAWAAARAAAWAAARDAASDAAWVLARAAQSRWLIENTQPMWEGVVE